MIWFRVLTMLVTGFWLSTAASPIIAQSPSNPAGRWALRVGSQTFMILELERGASHKWRGRLVSPRHFQLQPSTDVAIFSNVHGGVEIRAISSANATSDGLRLVITGATTTDQDDMLFRVTGAETALLSYVGFPIAPLPFVRAREGEQVATAWDPERTYATTHDWPTNAEMTSIFEADQADRQSSNIDWSIVGPRDHARRLRTLALLEAGMLQSGNDFYHAAFVLQHGSSPEDFLLAHTFAVVAAARGRLDATWIAAATLDRYLQRIGQRQIYGTQFTTRAGQPTTQEPYDRGLISDELRLALGVPPQSLQAEQAASHDAERHIQAPTPSAAPNQGPNP